MTLTIYSRGNWQKNPFPHHFGKVETLLHAHQTVVKIRF
jgi:hypothetical protein